MLIEYIRAAMCQAKYEILWDDGTFYGEIPGFQGVYANAAPLEDCREQLQEVLEGWIVLGLRLGHSL
jgi:predicted RNase H-like HicB family nuclease